MIKYYDQSSLWRKRVYFTSDFQVTVTTGESQSKNYIQQGRNLKAETELEAIGD